MSELNFCSLGEAYLESLDSPKWVFEGLVCPSLNLIYGRSTVGKSYLVLLMLLSMVTKERTFLGVAPYDGEKVWKPLILVTDPASKLEYAERFAQHSVELAMEVDIQLLPVGLMRTDKSWDELFEHPRFADRNFVVIDNLTGVMGDTNNAEYGAVLFDAINILVDRGIPVVVLHHETEKGQARAGQSPLGLSTYLQKARVWIQVMDRKPDGIKLHVKGNPIRGAWQLEADNVEWPNYNIVSPLSPVVPKAARASDRSKNVLDTNAEVADFVVAECQGLGYDETAIKLHEQFPHCEVATWKTSLTQRALKKLLKKSGRAASSKWVRIK